MKSKAFAAIFAAGLLAGAVPVFADSAHSAESVAIPKQQWASQGAFGTFDRDQLKRGWAVYKQVCAACHSLHQIYYRNLVEMGFSEAEAKEIAAADTVPGGLDDNGEPFTRPGLLSDKVLAPYANDKAARAANNGALPPDLSLMNKARKGGADYVYALMTGYKDAPTGFQLQPGMNYNEYFPGHQIAMPSPLVEDVVSYADGTKATVDQMAKDVSAFLTWTAEPELEDRKRMGIKVLGFLLVLTALLFALKRRIWADVH